MQEAALGEGLAPLLRWVKQLIDRVIAEEFGWLDLEFAWIDAPALSPLEQARIHELHVRSGIKTIDEVRAELGLDPLAAAAPARGEEGEAPDGDDETEAHEAGDDGARDGDGGEGHAAPASHTSSNTMTRRASALGPLARYSPLQPRVPRGDPAGGQWTTEGGGSLVVPATVRDPNNPTQRPEPILPGPGGGWRPPPSSSRPAPPPPGSGPGSLTRDDLIRASTQRPSTDKTQQIRDLPGGWEKANEYFDRLPRMGDIQVRQEPTGTVRIIEQPDGTTVNIRPFSSSGEKTIEFFPPRGSGQPAIKFRIGE